MHIAVCIKQVPSTNEVRLDPVTKTIIRDGKQSVINPFDTYAIEEAVRIRERIGGKVTALSMGIPATERLIRDALARGVDEGMLLTDRAFAGADTLATSYTLSLGIQEMGDVSLIICGRMAVDGDTAQIGPELAETLGIPHATDVVEIEDITEERIRVRRMTENGYQILEVKLPALITVVKDINMPRLPSISGIRYSMEGHFRKLTAANVPADRARLGLDGSPTQVVKTETPERRMVSASLDGSAAEQATQILTLWKEAAHGRIED
ncbi:MAG: electron transfer flavoprotein subunit beta/FixA family protein [Blautia sp.]|nr:electron transfer flavoprotein subunit beta/FixA family protein [Blautia sp.]